MYSIENTSFVSNLAHSLIIEWKMSTILTKMFCRVQNSNVAKKSLSACRPNCMQNNLAISQVKLHLCSKAKMDSSLIDLPLPELVITWRQNKQGKEQNKTEQSLSLNNLNTFQQKGCLICIEGRYGSSRPGWSS